LQTRTVTSTSVTATVSTTAAVSATVSAAATVTVSATATVTTVTARTPSGSDGKLRAAAVTVDVRTQLEMAEVWPVPIRVSLARPQHP
jgi:hypothetical protein